MQYAESIQCDRISPDYQALADAAYQAGYAAGLAGGPKPKPFLNGKRLYGLAANMLLAGYDDGLAATQETLEQAEAEIHEVLEAQAEAVAPEPPQSVRYSTQKRWEGYCYHYIIWDNFSRRPSCIGVYYETLSKDGWLINPADRKDRQVFQTEAEAREALIAIWEKGKETEQRLSDYVRFKLGA